MLSFLKKRTENDENTKNIQLIIDELHAQEKIRQEQWNTLWDSMQKLIAKQRKSETVIENIAEMVEEHSTFCLQQEDRKNKERILAGYILNYDEGMHRMVRMLRQAAGEGEEWANQIQILREQLCIGMAEINVSIIKEEDVPIDYSLHEVAGVYATSQKEKKDKVHEIIVPGLSLQGEVLQRAKIVAYKYQEGFDNEDYKHQEKLDNKDYKY